MAGFQRQIHINLIGSRNVAYTALPYLKHTRHYSKQRPELVFIASMAGLFPYYGYSEYATSTFGAVGLADVLRTELDQQDNDFAVVCPPEVETLMVTAERHSGSAITTALKQLLSVQRYRRYLP